MIRGLYTAATGMLTGSKKVDVIANNISNVDTDGYKKDIPVSGSFREVLTKRINDDTLGNKNIGTINYGSYVDQVYTIHSQGQLYQTDNNLDFAIQGDGYFEVETGEGVVYTRNGSFNRNSQGYLVDGQGNYVLGENGRIYIENDDISVDDRGSIFSDGVYIDRLRLVDFEDKTSLVKQGDNYFSQDGGAAPAQASIRQGFLEKSNVNPVDEMVEMISVMRNYETSQRMIKMQDQTLDKAVNEIARF